MNDFSVNVRGEDAPDFVTLWQQLKELQRAGWQFALTPTHTPFGVITSVVTWTRVVNPFMTVLDGERAVGVPVTSVIALIDADALPKVIADFYAWVFPISPVGDLPGREL